MIVIKIIILVTVIIVATAAMSWLALSWQFIRKKESSALLMAITISSWAVLVNAVSGALAAPHLLAETTPDALALSVLGWICLGIFGMIQLGIAGGQFNRRHELEGSGQEERGVLR